MRTTTIPERDQTEAREMLDRLEREFTSESRFSARGPGRAVVMARGLSRTYGKGDAAVHALRDVDIDITEGRLTAIMGPSGSGKSTLMHILAGLDQPTGGRVQIDGTEITRLKEKQLTQLRRDKIGFIFQSFNLIGDLTVEENVELPLTYRAGMPSAERKKRVKEALERVNMAHRMKHYPAQLSGGQQQRVAVARALAGSPSILLADEPTGNLDSKNGEAVMHLLADLHREGATICMVTHDPRFAKHAQREVHLFDGKVVSETELKKLEEEVEA